MAKSKIEYTELSRAKITDSRNIVISSCSKGGFTVAQQLQAKEKENDKITSVFLRGAYNLRDAVNVAIKMAEESGPNDEDWD